MAQSSQEISENSSNTEYDFFDNRVACVKLQLAENIAAYVEKKELERDVEVVVCDNSLLEKVTLNYLIAKRIISNLAWQEKILCKQVCTTWQSAVQALEKEQLNPVDFVLDMQMCKMINGLKFKQSNTCYTKPLAVLTFANTSGFVAIFTCEGFTESPCSPACEKKHCLIDIVHRNICAPKDCMLSVRAGYLSYMPLLNSPTYEHMITPKMFTASSPFIAGLYIPALPNVEFKVININFVDVMQRDFFDVVDKLAETRIIKGALVYVTESYLLKSVEQIVFLNYFKEVQPDIPYALGGCMVEDAIQNECEINKLIDSVNADEHVSFISENLLTIGLFSVPKDVVNTEDYANFDMYSLVIDSSDWTKVKIEKTINEFAKKVPHFEHSVVVKLSCVGRNQKHKVEQEYFRAAFPHTRLIGCYGNGELGLNHPARPTATNQPPAKRHRRYEGPQFHIMHSYSTIFVYIGWGKILAQPEGS